MRFEPRFGAMIIAVAFLAATAAAATNNAAWIEDVDFLGSQLPRLHANAFTRVSKESFDAAIRDLRNDVPSLADHEVIAGMMRVVAMIGDAHTTITAPEFARFPITVYWFSDGLYVTGSDEQHRNLIGARLVAIDARPIDEIVIAEAELIPHENEWWVRERAPDFLTTPEILHALHVIPTLGTGSFRFARSDGTTIDQSLDSMPGGAIQWIDPFAGKEKPLYLRNPLRNYWYDYDPSSQTLYVQYNRCRSDSARPIEKFGRELGGVVRSHTVSRLVLDLRHNGGGDSSLIEPLLRDVYVYAPYLDNPDRFFVVIGQATFSSAMANAVQIDQQSKATLIGQPTGGKPNLFGEVQTFQLPNSQLTVRYSTRYFTFMPDADPPTLMPEILVESSAAAYFAGRDPVMDRILARPPRRRPVRH